MSYLWYWPAGGWNFDDWKARQDWTAPTSEQSGQRDPLPLISPDTSLAQWQREAGKWRKVSEQILGTLSDGPPTEPRHEALGETFRADKYAMRRYRYSLTDEEWGYGWLLLPNERKVVDAVVIAHHQTVPGGKNEVVGLEAVPEEHAGVNYAQELANHGLAVFAPDAIAFGERQAAHRNAKYRSADGFFTAQPHGSVMLKMAFDTSRAIDFLQRLPEARGKRFGCIGHSHGAYGTLFSMLLEPRIGAGVMSCGVSLLRDDPSPERWWRRTALIPRLGFFEGKIAEAPIDSHHWLALLAPRPIMITGGTQDTIFPNQSALPSRLEMVKEVYALHGAGDAITWDVHDGPHRFTDAARQKAYALLEKALS